VPSTTPARVRNAPATRAAILDAARDLFSTRGFDRTTIRSVGAQAGVDPALVIRYFGSKDALFAAAARVELDLPDLTGVPAERFAELLVPHFFETWEERPTFLPLLRTAASNREAAETMARVFAQQITPMVAAVAPDHAAERAALLGAQVLGLAISRFVLELPAAVAMTREQVRDWLAPAFAYFLTGSAPTTAGSLRAGASSTGTTDG